MRNRYTKTIFSALLNVAILSVGWLLIDSKSYAGCCTFPIYLCQSDADRDSIGYGPQTVQTQSCSTTNQIDDQNENDNCPTLSNADQTDIDSDGVGDLCDNYVYDNDQDGYDNSVDNCPVTPGQNQSDTDGDGIGDICEAGLPDLGFNAHLNTIDRIYNSAIQPDGKILGLGMRFNTDGSLDTDFSIYTTDGGTNRNSSNVFAVQSDGKIIVGGYFVSINGILKDNIARLNQDGTVDNSFQAVIIGQVNDIAIQPDGKIIVASIGALTRLNPDGSVDYGFDPDISINSDVDGIKPQEDGKIIIFGDFKKINTVDRYSIARLSADGSWDENFITQFSQYESVLSLAQQGDGKIIVGSVSKQLVRLNTNGSFDYSFNVKIPTNENVYAIVIQADGKIIVGGGFDRFNGEVRKKIVRLNIDGSTDNSFNEYARNSNTYGAVYDLDIQEDGQLIVSGFFTTSYNGVPYTNIARFHSGPDVDRDGVEEAADAFPLNIAKWRAIPTPSDFSRDGTSDLVFHDGSGVVSTWILENAAVQSINTNIGSITPHNLKAICDVDHDLDADLLFQNAATGGVILWVMQNGLKQSETWLGALSGYTLSACGDTNKDGNSDLVFADSSGNFTVMTLNSNHTVLATTWLGQFSGWNFASIADVDADGDKDIVMQTAAGDIGLITLENGNKQSASWLGQWNGGWSVVGSGDADNDNDDDLFIATPAGDIGIVKLQAGANIGSDWFGNWPNTSVKAIGDINNDGDSDVIFQSTAYDLNVVDVQNAQKSGARWLGQLSGYDIKGPEDVDGDGDDDLVLQDGTGNVAVVVMQAGDKQSLPWLGSNNGSVKVFP